MYDCVCVFVFVCLFVPIYAMYVRVCVCGGSGGGGGSGGNDTDYTMPRRLVLGFYTYQYIHIYMLDCHRTCAWMDGVGLNAHGRADKLVEWLADWQDLWHIQQQQQQQLGMICVMVKTCKYNTDQRPNDCAQFYCMRLCVTSDSQTHTCDFFCFLCRFIYAERLALHS